MRGSKKLVQDHCLVLSKTPYQETHMICEFLSFKHGRISLLAPHARRSLRRFGASLEAFNYVVAQMEEPQPQKLARLNSLELKEGFLHLRKSYSQFEAAAFSVFLLQSVLPEFESCPEIFRSLGMYLRELEHIPRKQSLAAKAAFWSWVTHHLGYGDLTRPFRERLVGVGLFEAWHKHLAQPIPNLKALFALLAILDEPVFSPKDEKILYTKWINLSSIQMRQFERWQFSSAI